VSGDHVHADPADLRKLAKALEQFDQRVLEIAKQTQKAIDGTNWKDAQKDRFEARFRDFHRQTQRFVGGQVKDFVKQLNAHASDLERAKSRRF
jgi:hypothetical protein